MRSSLTGVHTARERNYIMRDYNIVDDTNKWNFLCKNIQI
jgi:hypothetical protein